MQLRWLARDPPSMQPESSTRLWQELIIQSSSNTNFSTLHPMKTFAYATAAAVACLATQTTAYDETTVCPSAELVKLLSLATDPYLASCQTASGYTFVPPKAYPTDSQVLLMCLTSDCYSLIADILALDPADCVINFGTVSINVLELADSFLPNCTALGLPA